MNHQSLSNFIWSVADLLRGDYKQSDYGKVILPFTVLRRLDCVLEEAAKLAADSSVLLVGPEGGWSDEERASGLPTVGLGDGVLRAETAAILQEIYEGRGDWPKLLGTLEILAARPEGGMDLDAAGFRPGPYHPTVAARGVMTALRR